MSVPSRQELTGQLTSELSYTPAGAELIADKIESLQPRLREAFESWWETGELPAVEVEGYTVERLVRKHSLYPLAALLTLDWLLREPRVAKATIERGHDRIGAPRRP